MENQLNENQNGKPEFNYFEERRKQKTKLIILIVVAFLLLITGTAYYLYFKYQKFETEQLEFNDSYRKEQIAALFSNAAYDDIPFVYKEYIYTFLIDNNYYYDESYFLTKIEDRAKNVFAFGDFTSDDNDYDDLAVLFENNDFRSSKLVIFNHKGELLFIEDYDNELPVINSYKVGSKIYMDEPKLVPSPSDGIIVKSPYTKKVVVYNKKSKKFDSFYQFTKKDLDAMNNDYYQDYDADYVAEPTPQDKNEEDFQIIEVK